MQFIKGARQTERADRVWRAENNLIRTKLINSIDKKRSRGRPKHRRQRDVVERVVRVLRPEWNEDLNYAFNREGRKRLILTAKGWSAKLKKKKEKT